MGFKKVQKMKHFFIKIFGRKKKIYYIYKVII